MLRMEAPVQEIPERFPNIFTSRPTGRSANSLLTIRKPAACTVAIKGRKRFVFRGAWQAGQSRNRHGKKAGRMNGSQLELCAAGEGNVVLFPLTNRIGEVRAAAAALLKQRSATAAARFRNALAKQKFTALAELGFNEDEQDEAVGAFLQAVERELAELHYQRIRLHL
jgi:hypothetical protein